MRLPKASRNANAVLRHKATHNMNTTASGIGLCGSYEYNYNHIMKSAPEDREPLKEISVLGEKNKAVYQIAGILERRCMHTINIIYTKYRQDHYKYKYCNQRPFCTVEHYSCK
jgi:hypothetical protein